MRHEEGSGFDWVAYALVRNRKSIEQLQAIRIAFLHSCELVSLSEQSST